MQLPECLGSSETSSAPKKKVDWEREGLTEIEEEAKDSLE